MSQDVTLFLAEALFTRTMQSLFRYHTTILVSCWGEIVVRLGLSIDCVVSMMMMMC